MAAKSKDRIIKELQEEIKKRDEWLQLSEERCVRLVKQADKEFANSSLRAKLESQLEDCKDLLQMQTLLTEKETHLRMRSDKKIKKILEDNQNFCKQNGKIYLEGMTADAWALIKELEEENTKLAAKISLLENELCAKEEKLEGYLSENSFLKTQVSEYVQGMASRSKSGRKPKFSQEEMDEIVREHGKGVSYRTLAKKYKCSLGCLSKICRQVLEDNNCGAVSAN